MKRVLLRVLVFTLCGGLLSCQDQGEKNFVSEEELSVPDGEVAKSLVTLGPVSASLEVSPKEPLIGDLMTLTLSVDAAEGVVLQMPGKSEAFSRFEVVNYSESRKPTAKGVRHLQSYVLQASRSGRLRIPPLRIAFSDEREEAIASEEQELLTEEIPIQVTPVLAGERATDAELRLLRGSLQEELGSSLVARFWWFGAIGIAGLLVLVTLLFVRRAKRMDEISPYERASVALASLESQGLPDAEALDDWYVRLSGIVREYLEGRFSLRAPELTTEEFLRVAQRSDRLSSEHKGLVSGFLADCDRVKFGGYEPGSDESRSVLEAARRFLLETRESENSNEEELGEAI